MPAVSRAMSINLGVFLLENSVRRNVGALSFNYPSNTASVTSFSTTVPAGQTVTWNSNSSSSTCTIIACSQNCDLSINLASPGTSYSLKSVKLHVVDSDVRQIVLTNSGTTDSDIRIFQS